MRQALGIEQAPCKRLHTAKTTPHHRCKTRYAKPFESVQVKIPYETGMNPYSGMVELLEAEGLLKQEGNRLKYIDPETGEEFKFYRKEWKDDKLDMIMDKFHLKPSTTVPEEKEENVE